ncbi:unnamed protein product, partial [Medioppia subpectinata]
QALADPTEYENLFPNFEDSLKAQTFLDKKREANGFEKASNFPNISYNHERNPIEEMKAEASGVEYNPHNNMSRNSMSASKESADFEEALSSLPKERDGKAEPKDNSLEDLDEDLDNLDLEDDNIDVSDVNLDEDLISDD